MMTKEELIAFENEIAEIYATGAIRGPIHLNDNGQADILIEIFKDIKSEDYVFSTWRNHWHFLLKDVPKKLVKEEILAGRSMGMQFPKYRAYSSSIVGGCLPIAVGAAWAIKNQKKRGKVYCFLGDMTLFCGIAMESIRYAINFHLPIQFIVEDNSKSVGTPTKAAWNSDAWEEIKQWRDAGSESYEYLKWYSYEMTRPHSGIGQFVSF
jgi:TPP-dependent pyruvate/acetoin dehydrogenase alpha subunit